MEKEKESLKCQIKCEAIQDNANEKEIEYLKKEMTLKDEQINDLKSKLNALEDKHEETLTVSSLRSYLLFQTLKTYRNVVDRVTIICNLDTWNQDQEN